MLADPNDDILELADGTRVIKSTGRVIKDKKSAVIEIPSAREAQEIVAKSRRSVADMPVPGQQMNGISLVVFYTMWGLNDQDIAIQLGCSIQQVKNIKKLQEYKQLHEDIFKNVMEYEATEVRGLLQQKARYAAERIIEFAEEEGALGFAASKDILDRAGHRPADVVEHRHKLENSLQIEFIRKEQNSENIPIIDAEFTEIG